MITFDYPVNLASRSPRRYNILKLIFKSIKVLKLDFDEYFYEQETPDRSAKRLAQEKMQKAKSKVKKGLIITADTLVYLDNKKLGKPENTEHAQELLQMLSGRTHQVYTGYSIYNTENRQSVNDYEMTEVTFRDISLDEIQYYIGGGSPMDKAGAYGIQDDYGAVFIERINGCYYNVVGLPISKVYQAILSVL